ncbi:uncharacterized protein MELLADRAFT_108096 [Melampsora larici-populina 98AG31]|uniref:Uncharacterized protein n=1 Tax=Melampsora larici-populina (strain 98AG31 / pathotype 3-4-7) TaxID=747676 RepID=F4RRY9_MELLP|nr:uncharacterized protein MELLADRAFT_108096 [Melampsora larici-populina 98AG31]EGG04869.1 hypothetical protein MELLADRAFT_108096 [Melampsora larici-populina 98AG31]
MESKWELGARMTESRTLWSASAYPHLVNKYPGLLQINHLTLTSKTRSLTMCPPTPSDGSPVLESNKSPAPTPTRNLCRHDTLPLPSPGFVFQSKDSRRALVPPSNSHSHSPANSSNSDKSMSILISEEASSNQSDQSSCESNDSMLRQARSSKASTSKKSVVVKKGQSSSGKRRTTRGKVPAMFKAKSKVRPIVPAKKRKRLAVEVSVSFFYLSFIC